MYDDVLLLLLHTDSTSLYKGKKQLLAGRRLRQLSSPSISLATTLLRLRQWHQSANGVGATSTYNVLVLHAAVSSRSGFDAASPQWHTIAYQKEPPFSCVCTELMRLAPSIESGWRRSGPPNVSNKIVNRNDACKSVHLLHMYVVILVVLRST